MIVLPSVLAGADNLDQDPRIHGLLDRLAGSGGYTAAIWASPLVLANAGLLDGKSATGYTGVLTGEKIPKGQPAPQPRSHRWQSDHLPWPGHGDGFRAAAHRVPGGQCPARRGGNGPGSGGLSDRGLL